MIKQFLCMLTLLLLNAGIVAQSTFTLQEAVAYAIDHSDDIQIDKLQVENADARVKEFKSIGMPKINASVDYQYYYLIPTQPLEDFVTPAVYGVLAQEGLADPFTGTLETREFSFFQKHNLTGRLSAEALVFDGSYLTGLKAARLYKDLQRKSIAVTEQEIKSNVTRAYLNILITDINAKTLQNNIENISKALNETKEIYKSGFAEQLDVDRLDLSFQTLTTELEKLEQIKSLSKNLLKFQMNYPLENDIKLTEDLSILLDQLKVENVALDDPIDYDKKAEVDQIMTGQRLNELDVERLEKGKLPSVFAFANFAEQLQRNNLFGKDEAGFIPNGAVGLGINLPLYDGGERSGKIQQVKLRMQQTDLELEQFKKAVRIQVFNARLQYVNAKKTLQNTENILDITQGIYDKTLIKFKEGVGSSVEVTQAEASLYDAQAARINAMYDLLNAKIELDIASGNL